MKRGPSRYCRDLGSTQSEHARRNGGGMAEYNCHLPQSDDDRLRRAIVFLCTGPSESSQQ